MLYKRQNNIILRVVIPVARATAKGWHSAAWSSRQTNLGIRYR